MKKREALINLLEAGGDLITADTSTIASDAWGGLSNALDVLLKVAEVHISEPEALEVVRAISKSRKECATHMKKYGAVNFATESQEDHMRLYNVLDKLKAVMNQPQPLKVEAGTYEIKYTVTGRGGATIEIMEGEEAADVIELYLLDTGMNLDDREVTITGIKKP